MIECDDESQNAIIPAIMLQPLVENALTHGVHSYLNGGIIRIQVYRKNEMVYILVHDNGVGITAKKLDIIQKNLYAKFVTSDKGQGFNSVGYRIYD